MRWKVLLGLVAGLTAAGIVLWAPWASPPLLLYETVSGYPMRVYYRNRGTAPAAVRAVNALPALSIDKPLSDEQIDKYLAEAKAQIKRAPTIVAPGDFMWFIADDPDELAWMPAKTEHTTWLYVFGVVEMPRSSIVNTKWVSELCLVSKTKEPFRPCDRHNDVYAGS